MKDKWKNKIYYSQCWEAPDILLSALEINVTDRVLSITSGGCNTISLLIANPREIIAIDINPVQNYLLELKMVAMQHLSYESFLSFLGVIDSPSRQNTYEEISKYLNQDAQNWWDKNLDLIEDGIIHSGKFERYLNFFRRFILPLIHSRKTIEELFISKSLTEQKRFYEDRWNTWRWKFLLRIFFSSTLLSLGGRNKSLFKYVKDSSIANYYLEKVKIPLQNNPDKNFFLRYIFTGKYELNNLPPYLRRENFDLINARLGRIRIISSSLSAYFSTDNQPFSKFNLSNIFENMTEKETEVLFNEIHLHSISGSVLLYINHLVPRLANSNTFICQKEKENSAENDTKIFFYKKIHIDQTT